MTWELPSRASAKPWQRWSSATLPTSMLTQAPLVLPSAFILSPAAKPEGYSSMPMCSIAPSSLLTSRPESIETTGMPAATAARLE